MHSHVTRVQSCNTSANYKLRALSKFTSVLTLCDVFSYTLLTSNNMISRTWKFFKVQFTGDQVVIVFSFASDWRRKWRQFSRPIIALRDISPMLFRITSDSLSENWSSSWQGKPSLAKKTFTWYDTPLYWKCLSKTTREMFNLREESSDYHLALSEVRELSRQLCVRILVTNH